MFPSSGLFIHISCPFSIRGLCERPHCLYKHAAESRETFGDQCDSNFTTVNDNSLHELERLDKQIESVRHEVEQEQRRLSSYQTNQADKSSNKLSTKFETNLSYGFSSSKNHKSYVQAKKYVVDNSKPRTDLEYDPMSNFSAALHSCSSSGKEAKNRPDRKSSRSFGEKPSTHQAQMYRPRSPEILDDDSTEDGVLVIDVSLSPDKTLDQTQHTADSGKSSQNTERDLKEIKAVNVYLDFQPQMVKTKVVNAASCDDADKVPEIHPVSSTLDKTKDCSNDERNVVDLTGCLEELERECENTGFQSPKRKKKWTEPGGFSFPSDQPSNLLMEQTYKAQKKDLKSQNSFVCKRSYPNTQFKQNSITDQDKLKVQSQLCVLQNGEKTKMKAFTNQKQVEAAQDSSQIQIHNVRSVNPHSRSESTEQLLQEEDEAVIIIDSSPEDEDHEDEVDYSELSESDPMEECYRIFMEANTEEKGSEEQGGASVSYKQKTFEMGDDAFHSISFQPLPVKRKLKQQSEAARDKVPHDVRQRYVNMFTEEFLKTTADVNEAFEKALTEEKSVYNRSVNKLKYLSIAVNALKRLKNQSNIPFNQRKMKENASSECFLLSAGDLVLYEILKGYTLTDEQMIENNYPVQHPEKPGSAVLFSDKKVSTDSLKRICCRCGATYSVGKTGKHLRTEECNYHYGKGVTNRVPGGVETRYSCCQGVMGAPGCQMFKLHVHDYLSLDGFVSTAPRRPSDSSCPGVYSLDCEMCYTVQGLELSRVTVISSSLQVVYDTFVKPDNEVIDYNTRFSGISEEDVKGNHTSLKEVQDTLLSFISADTILVGHGLETDLCLLKLLHGTVVDTSVVFPHRLGPPNKLSLNSLTAEYLRRIIQESVCGHDTGEDAAACMELMLWKMKEDGKLKK
uniref:RNA exonuclease 1 homolog n=1 Tax=Poecilia latipinna TaxID=48699 RepID=A0A3B3V8Q7_9TELE